MGEIERNMSMRELRHWSLFYARNPLPMELADLHHANLMSMLANYMRPTGAPLYSPRQFLVMRPPEPAAPAAETAEDEMRRFRALAGKD